GTGRGEAVSPVTAGRFAVSLCRGTLIDMESLRFGALFTRPEGLKPGGFYVWERSARLDRRARARIQDERSSLDASRRCEAYRRSGLGRGRGRALLLVVDVRSGFGFGFGRTTGLRQLWRG